MGARTLKAEEIPVNVVGSSTFGVHHKISSEKTYNMLISDEWLIDFPGYKRVYELFGNIGEGRGIFSSIRGNFILAIINSQVIRFDENIAPTTIGSLATASGEVFIEENLNNQICIVDGVNAYIYNHSLPPNLTIQVLGGGVIPNYVTFQNTLFLFGNADRSTNGAFWPAYAFDTATTIVQVALMTLQTKPDYAIAVLRIPSQGGNILVFGTSVCEVHTFQAGLLPYKRNNTISIDYGCLSVSTIDECDEYIAWLGVNEKSSPVILVYTGQGAQRISSDGIDNQLGNLKFPSHSTAMFLKVYGHLIYQLTFYHPEDNLTLFYDFTTQKFFNLSDENLNYHHARNYVYFNQKNYFVSINNASLYEISTNITVIDENIGNAQDQTKIHDLQTIRICANLKRTNSDRFIANRFVMTLEQGNDPDVTGASLNNITYLIVEQPTDPPNILITTEDGFFIVEEYAPNFAGNNNSTIPYQPRVDLTISLDGGVTWSSTVSKNLNPFGMRRNILSWNGLGMCNYLTLKLRFWGRSRFVAANGVVEVR